MAALPAVYYFPLFWKTNTVCQKGPFVESVSESPYNDPLSLLSLGADFAIPRILCERNCLAEYFNGFLNFIRQTDSCANPGPDMDMRFYCDCGVAASSCRGDTIRLTSGSFGFLEIFAYDKSLDRTSWFPYCLQGLQSTPAEQVIANVVCKTLGFLFEPKYGVQLQEDTIYKRETVYFPFRIDCSRATGKLNSCGFSATSPPDTFCGNGRRPLHVMCTTPVGQAPDLVKHVAEPEKTFEVFEGSVGRWTPVSELGWTPLENDLACDGSGKLDLLGAKRLSTCKRYYEFYKSRGIRALSGVYQIMLEGAFLPVLCDMDLPDPGWTLVLNNAFISTHYWKVEEAKFYNIYSPSKMDDYSILVQADVIIRSMPGKSVDIRIDAYGTGAKGAGGVFRIPFSQSLLSTEVSTNITIVAAKDGAGGFTDNTDPTSGFYLHIPHLTNWTKSNSIYGMNDNRRPSSRFGNIISRSPSKPQFSYWTPQQMKRPETIRMWLREVNDKDVGADCKDNEYFFESKMFSRRQLFASSSAQAGGYEPWQSYLGGNGWIPAAESASSWILVDLLCECQILKIVMSGVMTAETPVTTNWITAFTLSYKSKWDDLFTDVGKTFVGNSDAASFVTVNLPSAIKGRILRLSPTSVFGNGGLKWTVYGCRLQKHLSSQYIGHEPGSVSKAREFMLIKSPQIPNISNLSDDVRIEGHNFYHSPSLIFKNIKAVEVNLEKSVLIDELIVTGNPYVASKLTGVSIYASPDGARENLRIVNGTTGSWTVRTTFSMIDEILSITIQSFAARLIRLQFDDTSDPFRFEVVGRVIPDWCNLALSATSTMMTRSPGPNATTVLPVGYGRRNTVAVTSITTITLDFAAHSNISQPVIELYTVSAVAIQGYEATVTANIVISFAVSTQKDDDWIKHLTLNAVLITGEIQTINLAPPIAQARFFKLEFKFVSDTAAIQSVKTEVFGCPVQFPRHESFPGLNVLQGIRPATVAPVVPVVPVSHSPPSDMTPRKCFDNNKLGFLYNNKDPQCIPVSTLTLGFTRDRDPNYDLFWKLKPDNADSKVRPLISHVRCRKRETEFHQCSWRHAQDDIENPSNTILPDCKIYCGDPGIRSCWRRIDAVGKVGYDFSYNSNPTTTVTFRCQHDYLLPPPSDTVLECQKDGTWKQTSGEMCPKWSMTDLGKDRPIQLSSVDSHFSWVAKSWHDNRTPWDSKSLRCKATKVESYPYVFIDMETANDVHAVTIDFGIGKELADLNLDVYITNNLDPKLAIDDLCYKQRDVKDPPLFDPLPSSRKFVCTRAVIGRYVIVRIRETDPMRFFVCSILVHGSSCSPYQNLAEFQIAKPMPIQASTPLSNYFPFLAVDGILTLNFLASAVAPVSCAVLDPVAGDPWWSVDLGQESAVTGFTLYVEKSVIQASDVLTVYVSNAVPSSSDASEMCTIASNITNTISTQSNTGNQRISWPCQPNPVYGRYVKIARTGSSCLVPILSEVRVWGRNCAEAINRALFKPIQTSTLLSTSTWGNYLVDDDERTFFSSESETQPWVMIDLVGTYHIDKVELVTGSLKLTNVQVSTSKADPAQFTAFTTLITVIQVDQTFIISPGPSAVKYARYVKVTIGAPTTGTTNATPSVLQFREIRVISLACVENLKTEADINHNYRNLVLADQTVLNPATTKNDKGSAEAVATVDGIKFPRPTICFSTNIDARWQVTLSAIAQVYRILAYGRLSVPLLAKVDDQLCGSFSASDTGIREVAGICKADGVNTLGLNGTTISITKGSTRDKPITLCEVEVWGF